MNRRGFLRGILAAGAAPYVCTTAGVLMPIWPSIWTNDRMTATEVLERQRDMEDLIRKGLDQSVTDLMAFGISVIVNGCRIPPGEFSLTDNCVILKRPHGGEIQVIREIQHASLR